MEINRELKPLSANLKRLNIGKSLSDKEFEFIIEENFFDEIWIIAKNEWAKDEYRYALNDQCVGALILMLNALYTNYRENKEERYKEAFNRLLRISVIHHISLNPTQSLDQFFKTLDFDEDILYNETVQNITNYKNTRVALQTQVVSEKNIQDSFKKYQVFISSTYLDLKEERQAAVEAILHKGHIPAGMELFSANNKSQWEVIKKWIDDSDIYLLLLGGRYGSINDETKLSYTEMEYNYALEKNKAFFALVLDNEIINNKPTEIILDYDLKHPSYISFKKNITSKMCSFPKNIDQIKNHINTSLDEIIRDNHIKLSGWIKGNKL